MKKNVLKKVAKGKLTPHEAFEILYCPKPRKARFVRIKMNIEDAKGVSRLINILFFIPIPIIFGKLFIIRALKKHNIPTSIYKDFVSTSGGTKINVISTDTEIKVNVF